MLEVTRHGETNPCPGCGSRSVASILYGEPVPSDSLMRAMRSGEVRLAGCIVRTPTWYCNACGKEWGQDPRVMNS